MGTAYLAATYLEQIEFDKSKLVYVIGSTGITQELDDVGIKYLPIGVRFLSCIFYHFYEILILKSRYPSH